MAVKPKLALIPSGYKASKVYSVLPSSGVGDFDFSRSGQATRVNKDGLIETVDSNIPRLNYPMIDGVVSGCPSLLLEPERRNLIQYSEDFSGYSSNNLDIISNQNISPSGVLNGTFLRPTTDNSAHQIYKNASLTAGTNTLSVFIKAGNYSKFRLYFFDGTTAHEVKGNSSNGTIHSTNSTVKVESYSNGWYRYSVTATNVTYSSGNYTIRVTDESYQDVWSGNGVDGLYIFGLQFENGSYATSYIPNYGTALGVTRSAETCNGAGDAATFNDSEGVLMAEISSLANDSSLRTITLGDNSSSNAVSFRYDNPNQITLYLNSGGISQFSVAANVQALSFNKCLIKYKANDFSAWINGFEVGTNTSGSTFTSGTLDRINFDIGYASKDPFYGNTKQLQYFDTALTDTELETLTSWTSFNEMATDLLYTIQ